MNTFLFFSYFFYTFVEISELNHVRERGREIYHIVGRRVIRERGGKHKGDIVEYLEHALIATAVKYSGGRGTWGGAIEMHGFNRDVPRKLVLHNGVTKINFGVHRK